MDMINSRWPKSVYVHDFDTYKIFANNTHVETSNIDLDTSIRCKAIKR